MIFLHQTLPKSHQSDEDGDLYDRSFFVADHKDLSFDVCDSVKLLKRRDLYSLSRDSSSPLSVVCTFDRWVTS